MRLLYITLCFVVVANLSAKSQGCVAIRSAGGACVANHMGKHAEPSKWSLNVNNRYFKSYKHFRGEHEEKQRVENKTEVINHTNTIDFTLSRNLKNDWSLAVDLPIISNARSSLYEHDGKTRHSTYSFGIGDIRLT